MTSQKKKIRQNIVIAAVLLIVVAVFGAYVYKVHIPGHNLRRLEKARPEFEETFNQKMRELLPSYISFANYPEIQIAQNGVSVVSDFSWSGSSYRQKWICECRVEVRVNDVFFSLWNPEKSVQLQILEDQCEDAMDDYFDSFIEGLHCEGEKAWYGYPGLNTMDGNLEIKHTVSVKLRSAGNTYAPGYSDDEFYANGKKIVMIPLDSQKPSSTKKKKTTPTPQPSRTPTTFYPTYDDDDDDYYDDPYDVYDYTDPEDFYYDHQDDFYDFEDAEDYFYEYGDW